MAIPATVLAALTRLKPLLTVTGGLLIGIILVNFAGSMAFWIQPDLLWMQEWKSPDEQQRLAGEAARAEQIVTAGAQPAPFAMILGLSTAREDFEQSMLGSALGMKVLNLGSSGGSFEELDYYTQSLAGTRLHPELVVVGVHAAWLAGRKSPTSVGGSSRRKESLRAQVRQRVFLAGQFRRIHNSLHNALLAARERLDARMGFPPGLHLLSAPLSDPFESTPLRGAPRADPTFLATQQAAFEAIGWFIPERYEVSQPQVEAFQKVLARLQAMSSRVVVVLMPESRAFRDRVPPRAASVLFDSLKDPKPLIFDARAALPENAFYDLVHANQEGRRVLSGWLVSHLLQGTPGGEGGHKPEKRGG